MSYADTEAKSAYGINSGLVNAISREDRTVGENLDFKIARLEAELERLKASRNTLAPLLAMRVQDIRSAMEY